MTLRILPRLVLACLGLSLSGIPARAAPTPEQVKRYDRHKVVRVQVTSRAQIDALERSGATILNREPGLGPVDVLVTGQQFQEVEKLRLGVQVLHEDVESLVDAQRAQLLRADPFADFFLDYHPYGNASAAGTIRWYMNELVARYPALASLAQVGTTIRGRTIWALRITNDAIIEKPAVVYFSCQHAREWITPTVPLFLATHLLENYGIDPMITDLVDYTEFFLIPIVNVDGYIYSWTTDRM